MKNKIEKISSEHQMKQWKGIKYAIALYLKNNVHTLI